MKEEGNSRGDRVVEVGGGVLERLVTRSNWEERVSLIFFSFFSLFLFTKRVLLAAIRKNTDRCACRFFICALVGKGRELVGE